MGSTATQVLNNCHPGRVLTVFCEHVPSARHHVRAAAEEQSPMPTLVALEWEHAPALAQELHEIRDALAEAALSLWPNWYTTAEQRFEQQRAADLDLAELVAEAERAPSAASGHWLRQAWELCLQGKPPVVEQMAAAEQLRQLARALDPSQLVFAFSVEASRAAPARVRGLAGAAEWLASEAGAKTLLLLPDTWEGQSGLDHVTYGAMTLDLEEAAEAGPSVGPASAEATAESKLSDRRHSEAPTVMLGPIVGKPHPGSVVEQELCRLVAADAQLCGLFEYNQAIHVAGNKRYIVDLLWREGGLAVEMDGPEHHSPYYYTSDRERDYLLLLSGYVTLRVTNYEFYIDPGRVLEKLRAVVSHLSGQVRKESHELRT